MSTKLIDPSSGVVARIGRYDLVAEIASGGMATVYLARLSGVGGFQRNVAIKCLHPHLARNLEFVEMFLDEARLAALIHHPNVVPIQEVEESDQGYYLVMDYIEGDTFASLLSRSASLGRQVPREIALRIVIDTLTGLDAAHELRDDHGRVVGLVHRDVSPQNILVGTDGVARITDFGVARAASRLSATRAGQLKGKLAYMAPEQAGGEEEVDRRADVFSAGVVLWEALAFRRLFKASNEAATLTRVLTEVIVSPASVNPAVPENISRVCMRALDRDLNRRFVSCAEFADALERAAVELGILASTREVAAYVIEVVGDDVESHRRAIRQWLDRRERSQAGMASLARERSIAPAFPGRNAAETVRELPSEGSVVLAPDRPSLVGRLPPPGFALGSARPPADGYPDQTSSWPGTLGALPAVPLPPRLGAELTVPSLGVPPLPPSVMPPSAAMASSLIGDGPGVSRAAALLSMPSGSVDSAGFTHGLVPGSGFPPSSGVAATAAFSGAAALAHGGGPFSGSPLGISSVESAPLAPARRFHRGWWLAGLTALVLVFSFGLTWLLTDDRKAGGENGTLPLRSHTTAVGVVSGAVPAAGHTQNVGETARDPALAVPAPAGAGTSALRSADGVVGAVQPAPQNVTPEGVPASPPPAEAARQTPRPALPANRVVRTPSTSRRTPAGNPKPAAGPDLENPYQ